MTIRNDADGPAEPSSAANAAGLQMHQIVSEA